MVLYLSGSHFFEWPFGSGIFYKPGDDIPIEDPQILWELQQRGHRFETEVTLVRPGDPPSEDVGVVLDPVPTFPTAEERQPAPVVEQPERVTGLDAKKDDVGDVGERPVPVVESQPSPEERAQAPRTSIPGAEVTPRQPLPPRRPQTPR